MLHKVIFGYFNCGPTVASRSVLFLPKRPRGAYFVVLSSAGCKVGHRIRQLGFLVGWYDLTFESADLRRPRSDARTGRAAGLCFLDKLSGQRRIQDGQMSGIRNLCHRTFGQATSRTYDDLHPRPAKIGHSVDLGSPSLVSCLAHVTGLLARTTSQSQHHL